MTVRLAFALLVLFLAACGVDGPPSPPEGGGVTLSGEARIGMVGRL